MRSLNTCLVKLVVLLLGISTGHSSLVPGPRFANYGTNRVHYVRSGTQGEVVVLIHGWGGSIDSWYLQIPELQKHFQVVAIDLPGHGQSDKPGIPYTMQVFAEGVNAVLKDALISKAVLVGFSMGAPVMCKFYQMYPSKVSGLITLDGSLRGFDLTSEQWKGFVDPYKGPEYREAAGRFIDFMFPNPESAPLRERVRKTVVATPQNVLVGSFESLFDKFSWQPVKIEVPLLVVNAINPLWNEDYRAHVTKLQPKAVYKEISGTGHFLMLEKPQEVNAEIVQFVQNTVGEKGTQSLSKSSGDWKNLFDGKSLVGWKLYGKSEPPGAGWKVENGILKKLAGKKGGDIVTVEKFQNFELEWEWRLEPGGNNGLKYFVTEERPSAPGHEYQMIDDNGHPDAKVAKRLTATFYDVLTAGENKKLKPVGEWNFSRVVASGNHVEHWLNGDKVLEYELGSPALKTAIVESKFKNAVGFGTSIKGHIMLTDHSDEAWFRSIRIRSKD